MLVSADVNNCAKLVGNKVKAVIEAVKGVFILIKEVAKEVEKRGRDRKDSRRSKRQKAAVNNPFASEATNPLAE
jgi:sRNA-binding carbon storage regulator CsrA